ncbi:MAG TPA: hypothetical protein VK971_00475 [Thiohalobacter sp.]|nr:hypothetical protein [Thiohalobacter sp.]
MAAKKRRTRRAEAHVRLYRHELECPAYRTLSLSGRALLIEFRALFNGRENRIYMSVREVMRRLGVGQRVAERALAELLDRGWIRLIEAGSFNRKVRHASVYALESEPMDDAETAIAPKTYMHWRPPSQKNTVASMHTDGSQNEYRE